MKKSMPVTLILLTAMMTLFMTGCVRAPFVPPSGMAFTQFEAPLDVDYDKTDLNQVKKGTAGTTSILGLFAFGDASSQTAAKNAGISEIVHADYEYFNILGIFQKTTVIVYGK